MNTLYALSRAESQDSFLLINMLDGSTFFGDESQIHGDISLAYALSTSLDRNSVSLVIKDCKGNILCSEPSGKLICNRTKVGPWEVFKALPISLLSSNEARFFLIDHHGSQCLDVPLQLASLPHNNIEDINAIERIFDINLISLGNNLAKASVSIFEPGYLFALSEHKNRRRMSFKQFFDESPPTFFITDFFHSVDLGDEIFNDLQVERLGSPLTPEMRINDGRPAVAVFNNNNCAHSLKHGMWEEIQRNNPKTFFVVWDYDNHHWMSNSFRIAAHSDLYIPSHLENIANLGYLATRPIDLVPCGVNQFTKIGLHGLLELTLSEFQARKIITGMHRYYSDFSLRNFLIANFSAAGYDEIGFTPENKYSANTYSENLSYWSQFALSFVAPVQGDLPIRIFDSISTGGMPIIPWFLGQQMQLYSVPSDFYFMYNFDDLNNPKAFVTKCHECYLDLGLEGMRNRIHFGIERLHISASLRRIFDLALNAIQA